MNVSDDSISLDRSRPFVDIVFDRTGKRIPELEGESSTCLG